MDRVKPFVMSSDSGSSQINGCLHRGVRSSHRDRFSIFTSLPVRGRKCMQVLMGGKLLLATPFHRAKIY